MSRDSAFDGSVYLTDRIYISKIYRHYHSLDTISQIVPSRAQSSDIDRILKSDRSRIPPQKYYVCIF